MMGNKNTITIGLIGNPNTGKTSLLNSLTGSSLHVGNWPGKTVEKKEGEINFRDKKIKVVDLPGTYDISPYSDEEKVSKNFITRPNCDIIIQIVDVNALERNLLLTLELLTLKKPIILTFNFNKEAAKRGVKINIAKIEKVLNIPIVQIEANTGENKEELLEEIIRVSKSEFKEPSYIEALLKNKEEISHRESIRFIKNEIGHFYSTEKQNRKTEKIDSIILNKYTAFPIFLAVMFLMFKISFSISIPIVDFIGISLGHLGELIRDLNLPDFLISFLTEGIVGGMGSVIAFIPLIFFLFIAIAVLEDSGYLSRTVVLIDRLFQTFGVSGRTFIPMILGFGCNVPAIMATRIIRYKKERMIAIFTNSFISCSAKLPAYVLFATIFFPENAVNVIMSLYLLGIIVALAASLILSKLIKNNREKALIIELPPYRMPTVVNVVKHAWHQTSLFIKKAGTIIFAAVVIIWVLANLPAGTEYGSQETIIGIVGEKLSCIFEPLGFGHWTFAVTLLFGVAAKEIIIGTLGTLHGVSGEGLLSVIPNCITPLGALSFLIFVLLYSPCVATIAVIKKETDSWKFTIAQVAATLIIAWIVSFLFYNTGLLLGFK
ncbi:ferrous iron transport protein B [bacterium]|nr:ferrous iron transport protein B [bacterium]